MEEIQYNSFTVKTDLTRTSRTEMSLWKCRECVTVVTAEAYIIYAIRAKLGSCATGQVEQCALADILSCSVSKSPVPRINCVGPLETRMSR